MERLAATNTVAIALRVKMMWPVSEVIVIAHYFSANLSNMVQRLFYDHFQQIPISR
jgi:hypothetical protein